MLQCEKEREKKRDGENPSPSQPHISCCGCIHICTYLHAGMCTHTLRCRHACKCKLAREYTNRHAHSERGSASVTQHGKIRLLCNSEICNLHVNNPWSAASPGCSASSLSLPTSLPLLRVPIHSRTSTSLHLTANAERERKGEENGGWMVERGKKRRDV